MKNSEEVFGGSRCVTDPRQARRIRDPVVGDHKPKYDMLGHRELYQRGIDSPVNSSLFVGYKRQRGGGTNSRLNAACSGGGRGGGDGSVGGAQKRGGEE
ncbi:hypothetical protein Bca4012_049713 [Brassica carinata]